MGDAVPAFAGAQPGLQPYGLPSQRRAPASLPSSASGRGRGKRRRRLLGALALQRPPALDQSQPKCPVPCIACSSGKAPAFIGASPEFIVRAGPHDLEGEIFRGHGVGLRVTGNRAATRFAAKQYRTKQEPQSREAAQLCSVRNTSAIFGRHLIETTFRPRRWGVSSNGWGGGGWPRFPRLGARNRGHTRALR